MISRSLLAPARLAGQSVLRTQSDERLADLAREGSKPAFEAIVARYRGALLGYCGGMLSAERAEDAVQQTLVKAYAALQRGEAVRTLRPWLYRIAHNTAINGLRDRGLHHAELDEAVDGVERPDQAAERRQELGQVVAAVKALPERQRDAILLRELEGRGYEEIAAQLGGTHGAVRQLLNRARCTLRAGMTALTPFGLVARLGAPLTEAPVGVRIAELCGAAGAAKICATALATGAIAGAGSVPAVDHEKAQRTAADVTASAAAAPPSGRPVAAPTGATAAQGAAAPTTRTTAPAKRQAHPRRRLVREGDLDSEPRERDRSDERSERGHRDHAGEQLAYQPQSDEPAGSRQQGDRQMRTRGADAGHEHGASAPRADEESVPVGAPAEDLSGQPLR